MPVIVAGSRQGQGAGQANSAGQNRARAIISRNSIIPAIEPGL